MKKTKKILLSCLAVLLLLACEKEDNGYKNNETNKITRKKISLKELKNHESIFNKFDEISKKTNKDINNRLVIDTLYNFIIDTENMILNQYENYTSITAPIFRINNNTEVVENLFIHKTNSGSYKAFIVKYSLSDSDLVNYSNNTPISDLASKTSFIVLDNFNLNNINNRDNSLENTTYSGGYSGIVYNIDGQCYRIHEVFQDGTFSLIHCPGCSCSSNNNSVPNLFENDGSGGTSNVLIFTWPTSGGEDYDPFSGIGGSGGNYSGGNTLITEPVVTQNRTEQKLLQSFTTLEQSNWWLFVASDETKHYIINYLNQNTINNVINSISLDFIINFIEAITDNNIEIESEYNGDFLEFDNLNDVINHLNNEVVDLSISSSQDFAQNKKITIKTIELNPLMDIVIELVMTLNPNFSLDKDNCSTDLDTLLPGNDWKTNYIVVSQDNYNDDPNVAEISISGYILTGIKIGEFQRGVKKRKHIILRVDKNTGHIFYSEIRNIN